MYFLTYWEIFGIVLVTLYFVLSLLFPKTENSEKEQQKRHHEDTKSTPGTSFNTDHKKVPEKSVFASPEQGEDECDDVWSSNAHRELSSSNQQEVRSGLLKRYTVSSKHQDIACVSEDDVSPIHQVAHTLGKDAPVQPLQSNLCQAPSDAKLSELAHDSVSTSKPPQEFLHCSTNCDLYDDENISKHREVHNPDEQPSKYLYKEFENGEKGLHQNVVCISEISDSADKFCGNVASTEVDSSPSQNLVAEGFLEPVNTEKMNLSGEITSELQNNNNLEKFADGLATSAIETAVDNSVCLNNFAENLSEKIFWASADDVISEVHASIEKKEQEGTIEPIKLESLSRNVASEVVNEAIGEAALREEYMIDKAPKAASPIIQPHLGYVVENVVNNAICEAALRLKEGENDMRETDNIEDDSHIPESESSNISALSDTIAETVSNDDSALQKEQSEELLKYPSNEQNEDQEIQSSKVEIPINKTEVKLESKDHASDNCTEKEKFTKPAAFDKEVSKIDSPQGQAILSQARLIAQEDKVGIDNQGHQTKHVGQKNITEEGCSAEAASNTSVSFEPQAVTSPDEVGSDKLKIQLVITNGNESDSVDRIEDEESIITSHRITDEKKSIEESDDDALEQAKISSVTDEMRVETQEQVNINSYVQKSNLLHKEGIVELDKEVDVMESKPPVALQIGNQDKFKEEIDNPNDSLPEIKLYPDIDKSQSSSEYEEVVSAISSPEEDDKVTLREKPDNNKESFWRRSLILDLEEDLEEDFEPDESFSSGPSSPGSPKTFEQRMLSEGSEELTDSEEDEIIDHDADAKLGAVGGFHTATQHVAEEEFDLYDYGSDDDDTFDPVYTVDGLCMSKQSEKRSKQREILKSVGSHYNRAIVMDNGCGSIKLGYAGDRVPRVNQQSVSGIPSRYSMQITGLGTNLRDFKKFGSEAVSKAGVMHLSHPMKAGMIDNWTDVEDIWEHMIFNELGAEVGDNPIIMTEISQNSKKNREKITEILFEHFNVPAMYLADQLPLSIYASGRTSGVCLSSGYSCSQAAVVYEGHTLSYTVQHLDIGGGHLTENLKILLRDNRGHNFTTSSGWQIVNDIKETIAFVAKDYKSEVQKYKTNDALTKYYTLPDGQVIDIGYECMSSVEPLFQPDELMSADATTASQLPVHHLVNSAIKRCDKDLQQMCHNNVILSGGTTLMNGFTARLQHELHQINHSIRKIRTPEHRHYSSWIGGSILGSLSLFDEQYVTMDEYGDSGPRIVHKKCF